MQAAAAARCSGVMPSCRFIQCAKAQKAAGTGHWQAGHQQCAGCLAVCEARCSASKLAEPVCVLTSLLAIHQQVLRRKDPLHDHSGGADTPLLCAGGRVGMTDVGAAQVARRRR